MTEVVAAVGACAYVALARVAWRIAAREWRLLRADLRRRR